MSKSEQKEKSSKSGEESAQANDFNFCRPYNKWCTVTCLCKIVGKGRKFGKRSLSHLFTLEGRLRQSSLSIGIAVMNIREATVSDQQSCIYSLEGADFGCKVNDQLGMQNCNLHNLPENYTMRYCEREWKGYLDSAASDRELLSYRLLSCSHMATAFLCCRR